MLCTDDIFYVYPVVNFFLTVRHNIRNIFVEEGQENESLSYFNATDIFIMQKFKQFPNGLRW